MLELDHLPFTVVDVDSASALLRRLGFEPTSTGVCRWSQNGQAYSARCASVVFGRGYVDLIEWRDADWERRLRASPVHHQGLAPSGVVLGTASLDAARARLTSSGVTTGAAYEIVRELPGAEPATIRYEIFPLNDPALPFAVIRDSAPRAMRTDAWIRHPNTASAVRCIHVRVPSLDAWSTRAAQLELDAATLVAHEEPRDPYLASLSALLTRRDRTLVLAVELSVTDLTSARTILEKSGLPWLELDAGVALDPTAGCGCGILFTSRGER